jgi:hypothetical protein
LAGKRQRGQGRIEKREGNPRFAAAATLQGIVYEEVVYEEVG